MVDPSPPVEKLFQMFDTDKSGQIDVKEFMIGLSNFTGASKDEKLKFAFSVFDDNGDGVITRVSTRLLFRCLASSLVPVLCPSADLFTAQRLCFAICTTQDELIKILKANHMASSEKEVVKKAETILAQADKDGDGVINFDEFVLVSKRFPNILYPSVSYSSLFCCDSFPSPSSFPSRARADSLPSHPPSFAAPPSSPRSAVHSGSEGHQESRRLTIYLMHPGCHSLVVQLCATDCFSGSPNRHSFISASFRSPRCTDQMQSPGAGTCAALLLSSGMPPMS